MTKAEVIKMAQKHSRDIMYQESYLAGFQAACNIVRQKIKTCYNEDFCNEMEALSNVAYMDLSSDN